MSLKSFIKSRLGAYSWEPDNEFFKSITDYVRSNGELLNKEVHPAENTEVFTYRVKTPNGKSFIIYLDIDNDLGYDPDPAVDLKIGPDLFDSTQIAYGPNRTMDKVRKEWDAIKNGTASDEYYQATYSISVPVVSNLFRLRPDFEYELIDLDKGQVALAIEETLKSFGSRFDETKFLNVMPPSDFSKLDDRLLKLAKDHIIDPIEKTEYYIFNDFIYCFFPDYPDSNGSVSLIIPMTIAESMIPSGAKVEIGDHEYKTYSNQITNTLPSKIDSTLIDICQMYPVGLDYTKVTELGKKWESLDWDIKHKIHQLVTEVAFDQEDRDDYEAEQSAERLVDYLVSKNLISK